LRTWPRSKPFEAIAAYLAGLPSSASARTRGRRTSTGRIAAARGFLGDQGTPTDLAAALGGGLVAGSATAAPPVSRRWRSPRAAFKVLKFFPRHESLRREPASLREVVKSVAAHAADPNMPRGTVAARRRVIDSQEHPRP
jgi:hypothetical protein